MTYEVCFFVFIFQVVSVMPENNLLTLTLNEDEANMIPLPGDANRNGVPLPRNEMALNLQIAFSNSFSAMKSALLCF